MGRHATVGNHCKTALIRIPSISVTIYRHLACNHLGVNREVILLTIRKGITFQLQPLTLRPDREKNTTCPGGSICMKTGGSKLAVNVTDMKKGFNDQCTDRAITDHRPESSSTRW